MRVFVTGASGYIGHSVAQAFRRAGHTVTGLVRSEENANALLAAEITPVMGDIGRPETFQQSAQEAEVLVHCAFDPSANAVEKDAKVITTFIDAAKQSNHQKTFIYTSGVWVYGNTFPRVMDEAMTLEPISLAKWRVTHEQKVLHATSEKFRTAIIRPGCVYGGRSGLTSSWFHASQKGMIPVINHGENYWATIHVEDLARVYVLCAEQEMRTVILNATDGVPAKVRDMVEAVARVAGIHGKLHNISLAEGEQLLGPVWEGFAINQLVSNHRARSLLRWQPHHLSFVEGVEHYFQAWKAREK